MKWFLVVALLVMWASSSQSATLRLSLVLPAFNADSTCTSCPCDSIGAPLTDLKLLRFYGYTFTEPDTIIVGEWNVASMEGDTVNVDIDIEDGKMGEVWPVPVDYAENEGCVYNHYVFAFPALEYTPGLDATYYNDANLLAPFCTRVDPIIDFDWGSGSACSGLSGTFSAEWVGIVRPAFSGLYTFRMLVNDAGRLWVGSTKIIDDWDTITGEHSVSGVITLTAGVEYAIRVNMRDQIDNAMCKLYWTPPGRTETIVPAEALSH